MNTPATAVEPSEPLSQRLPMPSSRAMAWIGVVLVVVPLLSLAYVGWMQFRELRHDESRRLELLATVLEDHATRTIDAAGNALSVLADHLGSPGDTNATPEALTPLMLQSVASLPALRGLAIVDSNGHVVASTMPTEVGLDIDLAGLGPLPDPGKDGLGDLVPGTGLLRLAREAAARPATAGASFMPLMRHVKDTKGLNVFLVALLNPEHFAGQQQLTVTDEHVAAVLTTYGGNVVAALPWVQVEPGARLAHHPLFVDFNLQRDHGSFMGAGIRPETQLTAFRVSRTRPLVMLLEMPREQLILMWWDSMIPYFVGRLALLLGVLALTLYGWLALRAHERAQRGQQSVREAVASRERELTELFKLVPELIFRADRDGRVTFINGRYADVSGRSVGHAIGKLLQELFLAGSRPDVMALFELDRGRAPRRATAMLGGPYGVERRFDITVVPLYEGDQLLAFAGSAVDETERLMLQDSLRGQVEHTARLLELCPVPVSIVDRDSHFLTVNRAWEQFNMRGRNEVIGRLAGENWSAADRAAHRECDEHLLKHGGSFTADVVYTRVDQSRRLVRITKVAVPGADGKPVAVLNSFVDLTEFRDAERAIASAREAAEQVSRMKSEFISSVSHEMRTPLQSILGFTEIGQARALTRERQLELFGEIHRSGQGMLRMVNDLLDLARTEKAAPLPDPYPPLDLRGVVEAVRDEAGPSLATKSLSLSLTLGPRPLRVSMEPAQAHRMVTKLIANAVEVSPFNGRVEIVGWVFGGEAVLQVRDQGPDIPEAALGRIFEPFSSAHPTKGQPDAGTGLNLAISQRIASASGGSLQAIARPEGGTIYELSIPCIDIDLAPAPPRQPVRPVQPPAGELTPVA